MDGEKEKEEPVKCKWWNWIGCDDPCKKKAPLPSQKCDITCSALPNLPAQPTLSFLPPQSTLFSSLTMFRFGRFDMGDASSPSMEGEQQQQQDGVSNSSSNSNKSTSFLQRMASADTLLRSSAPLMKRPSFSSLQNSFSSSSGSSIASSFSIPVPTNSWGMLALSRLRAADDGEFDDVIDLLLTRDKVWR